MDETEEDDRKLRLKPPPFDDFSDAADIFGDNPRADALINLLARAEDPIVCAVEGAWGSGKTIFLRRLIKRAKGIDCLYFDASELDFHNNAFVALCGKLLAHLDERGLASDKANARGEFLKKAGRLASAAGSAALAVGVSAATLGQIQREDVDAVFDAINKARTDDPNPERTLFVRSIEAYSQKESALDEFKNSLSELKKEDQKIIVIIDELDRCDTKFALDILQCCKHIFSTKEIKIIIGCNTDFFDRSINHLYEHRSYLEKYVDFKFNIGQSLGKRDRNKHRLFSKYLFENTYENETKSRQFGRDSFPWSLEKFSALLDLSLREMERVAQLSRLYVLSCGNGIRSAPPIIIGTACLSLREPALFLQCANDELSWEQFHKAIPLPVMDQGGRVSHICRWWRAALGDKPLNEDDDIAMQGLFEEPEFGGAEPPRTVAQRMSMFVTSD